MYFAALKSKSRLLQRFVIFYKTRQTLPHPKNDYEGHCVNQQNQDDLKKYQFISKLKNLPFIEKIILFGSRARGTQQSRSDIDLAIVCPLATKDQWREVLEIIDEADTLLLIDCVRFDSTDDEFKKRILKDGVIL